jgi:hypothetical protein
MTDFRLYADTTKIRHFGVPNTERLKYVENHSMICKKVTKITDR